MSASPDMESVMPRAQPARRDDKRQPPARPWESDEDQAAPQIANPGPLSWGSGDDDDDEDDEEE